MHAPYIAVHNRLITKSHAPYITDQFTNYTLSFWKDRTRDCLHRGRASFSQHCMYLHVPHALHHVQVFPHFKARNKCRIHQNRQMSPDRKNHNNSRSRKKSCDPERRRKQKHHQWSRDINNYCRNYIRGGCLRNYQYALVYLGLPR